MLPPATVNIFGLVRPVTVHWATEAGVTTVVVGEKSGIIKASAGQGRAPPPPSKLRTHALPSLAHAPPTPPHPTPCAARRS